jgi:MYXO-CTERM domain-containing protein
VGNLNVGVGLIPDQSPASPCTGLCGTDSNYFNNATEVHAHVLLNLVTNVEYGQWNQAGTGVVARPVAWYNLGGTVHQMTDLCTGQPADVGGFTVEMGWSNLQVACVASAATTLPICTAGTTYCRQCDSTDVGQDGGCTAATAQCEMDNANTAFGECVQCTSATNCSGTTPVCAKGGTANDSCRACAGDGECTTNAAGPRCLTSGACGPTPSTSSSSSGCSSTGTSASALALVLGLLALALRRR